MLEGWQKELLRTHRVELIDSIIPDDLVNKLYAKHIITRRQLIDIPHNRNPLQQIEMILNILETRPPKDYYSFCECLRDTNQGDVVNKYLLKSSDDDDTRVSDSVSESQTSSDANSTFSPCRGVTAGHSSIRQPSGVPSPSVTQSPALPGSSTVKRESPEAAFEKLWTEFECDAEHDVFVTSSSENFYNATKFMAFPMSKPKRGKAIVFNIMSIFGRRPRKGTDVDRDKLFELLLQLHFDVIVYNDGDGLSAEGIKSKFKSFSDSFDGEEQCAVVCMLSHGAEGTIYGTDGVEVEIDSLLDMLDLRLCPALRGKPKLVFMQACRGKRADTGVLYESDAIMDDEVTRQVRRHPCREDFLVTYPTQPGYMSWRNTKKGSFFIGALVQIFMKYACSEDICTLLHMVNKLVARTVANIEGIEHVEMSMYESSLSSKPKFYFYPGIVEES